MQQFIVTYQIEIIADTHEQAAIKGIKFLTEDLSNPYTELSVTTETLAVSPKGDIAIRTSEKDHLIGISKDSRGHQTVHLVHDAGDGAQK